MKALAAYGLLAWAVFVGSPSISTAQDMLHYSASRVLEPGTFGNIGASIQMTRDWETNSDNQTLVLTLSGLVDRGFYKLLARIDGDTNWMQVAEFTSNAAGDARLEYGTGKAEPRWARLPNRLNPVTVIRELEIVSRNGSPVLRADMTMPDTLHYVANRNLQDGGLAGMLQINASMHNGGKIRFMAAGLKPGNNYALVFDGVIAKSGGSVVQTATADPAGRLKMKVPLNFPGDLLGSEVLSLQDMGGNMILSTTVP